MKKRMKMKKTYITPETDVVELQHCATVLAGSLSDIDSNLKGDDVIGLEDDPMGEGFLGR